MEIKWECVESCPHCGEENIYPNYDVIGNKYKAICQTCGATIMLCDECIHSDDFTGCDWHGTYKDGKCYGKCFRGETVNPEHTKGEKANDI